MALRSVGHDPDGEVFDVGGGGVVVVDGNEWDSQLDPGWLYVKNSILGPTGIRVSCTN